MTLGFVLVALFYQRMARIQFKHRIETIRYFPKSRPMQNKKNLFPFFFLKKIKIVLMSKTWAQILNMNLIFSLQSHVGTQLAYFLIAEKKVAILSSSLQYNGIKSFNTMVCQST